MSWLPAMMFMHALNDDGPDLPQNPPYPVEQYSTGCNAGNTPVVAEIRPPATNSTHASNSSNAEDAHATANSTRRTPTVATRAWHHTAMSAATFTLSALLGYIATETIFKRVRSRN